MLELRQQKYAMTKTLNLPCLGKYKAVVFKNTCKTKNYNIQSFKCSCSGNLHHLFFFLHLLEFSGFPIAKACTLLLNITLA